MSNATQYTAEQNARYRKMVTATVHKGRPPIRQYNEAMQMSQELSAGECDGWQYKLEPGHVVGAFYLVVYDEEGSFVDYF